MTLGWRKMLCRRTHHCRQGIVKGEARKYRTDGEDCQAWLGIPVKLMHAVEDVRFIAGAVSVVILWL